MGEDALTVAGPALALRLPRPGDAPALFALGRDPEVTRFLSWGPYRHEDEARAFLAGLPGQRARGEQLGLAVVHHEAGPIGVTTLSELSRRDRRAVVGSWLGRAWWGTGVNREAKALVAHLAFGALGLERLAAYANVRHERSQAALRALGFVPEGVLRRFHRHGDAVHDVAVLSLLRDEWARGPLAAVPVALAGSVPAPFAPAPG